MYQTFVTTYRNQFKEILYMKSSYCRQHFNIELLNKTIYEQRILHQDRAIEEILSVLSAEERNNESLDDGDHHRLKTLAFVGTHGVGKTLLSTAIMDGFPWPKNVHRYFWNTKVGDEYQRFHILRVIIEQLTACGWNLLIIDNLSVCDYGLVAIINRQFFEVTANTEQKLIIIYVFNLDTLTEKDSMEKQMRYIQDLNVTKLVYFKQFNRNEQLQCIYREMDLEEMELELEDLNDILDGIDPLESGCKKINSKVLMYGTMKRS